MKTKIAKLILVAVGLFGVILSAYLLTVNNKLQKQIEVQNKLMEKFSEIQSRLNKGENDLLESLNEFMDGNSFIIDGEDASIESFLKRHNEIKDSLNLINSFYEYSKKHYGVNLQKIYLTDSTYTITSEPYTKADSAASLYPHFKNKLTVKGNVWTTDITDHNDAYYDLVIEYNKLRTEFDEINRKLKSLHDELKNINQLQTDSIINNEVLTN